MGEFQVKSGLQILKESADQHTFEEWAEIAGVRAKDLVEIAVEFTSHGKNAAVDIHRGVSQHTNGYYNTLAWFNLALLIGNYDWRGGQSWPSTYDISGGKAEGPFNLGKMNPGALSPFGLSLIRHELKYEDTTLFLDVPEDKRYPARRNWYPLASDIYQEIIPSAADGYPYPVKAVFMYMGSPVYSLPAGHTWIPILQDVDKIPLFVASDIVIGESSMYADYIFPDVTYLERWEFSGTHPSVTFKVQGVRQPVIAPLTGTVKVYGQEMALQWEALLLAMAEKLGLPNFGPNGLGQGADFTHPDDLYLRMIANLAYGEKKEAEDAVHDADEEELRLFLAARRHLPKAVFDAERWHKITGDLWPKVVTVLNRGGRFQAFEKGYPGDGVFPGFFDEPFVIPTGVKFGKQINMYLEKTAGVKHSGTGKSLPGYATYFEPGTTYDGTVLDDAKDGFDLKLRPYAENCVIRPVGAGLRAAPTKLHTNRQTAETHHLPRRAPHQDPHARQLLAAGHLARELRSDERRRRPGARAGRRRGGQDRLGHQPGRRMGSGQRTAHADDRQGQGRAGHAPRRDRLLAVLRPLGLRGPRRGGGRRDDQGRSAPRHGHSRQRRHAHRPVPQEHYAQRRGRRQRGVLRHDGEGGESVERDGW